MNSEWINKQKMRTECRQFAPKLSEYVDGYLDNDLTWRIKNHVAACSSCFSTVSTFTSVARLLGSSTRHETSSDFAAVLEARIAAMPRKRSLPTEHAPFFSEKRLAWIGLSSIPVRLTGSFAMAAAFLACVFILSKPPGNPYTAPAPAATSIASIDGLVDQHRVQSAGDPLSDTSAQLLASSVDTIKVDPSKNHKLSDDDAAVLLDEEM